MSERLEVDWLTAAMMLSPDGPEQAAYRAHLEKAASKGVSVTRVSWGPDADKLACTLVGREELFKSLKL